jgi:hypothetical protein
MECVIIEENLEKQMLKTSQEWQDVLEEFIVVEDPDGWDRSPGGFDKSWYEELINYDMFMQRLAISTCRFKLDKGKNIIDLFQAMDDKVAKLGLLETAEETKEKV